MYSEIIEKMRSVIFDISKLNIQAVSKGENKYISNYQIQILRQKCVLKSLAFLNKEFDDFLASNNNKEQDNVKETFLRLIEYVKKDEVQNIKNLTNQISYLKKNRLGTITITRLDAQIIYELYKRCDTENDNKVGIKIDVNDTNIYDFDALNNFIQHHK